MTTTSRRAAKRLLTDVGAYIAGAVIYAFSVHCFSAPNHIAPGGTTGVATLINYLVPFLPIGGLIMLLNLPLLFLLWRASGWRVTVRVAAVTFLASGIIDLLAVEPIARWFPPFMGDRILVAVFGGVLAGFGLGLIYLRGASTGGSEILASLLNRRFPHIPVGRLIFLVDAVVIAAAMLVYGQVESALYAVVLVYVSTTVMNSLIYGGDAGRVLLVMSSKPDRIAEAVMRDMQRGVTLLDGKGAYSGEARQVLLCAVRRIEMYRLKTIVYDADPRAFIIVLPSEQVLGEGFRSADTH